MTLAPTTTALAKVYTVGGTTATTSGTEAMSEVDMTNFGHPEHTVYEITSTAKRFWVLPSATVTAPTFEADTAGNGSFVTISPSRYTLEYPGGRMILLPAYARGSSDVVRCKSASLTYYTTISELLGASLAKVNTGSTLADVTLLGDTYVRRHPTVTDFTATVDAFAMKSCASYTTTGGNANSHLLFLDSAGGSTSGNTRSITLTDPSGLQPALVIAVTGYDVEITLKSTAAPAITSTASEIAAAVSADPACQAIGFTASLVGSETGAGVVAALTKTDLTGGLDATDYTATFSIPIVVSIFMSTGVYSRLEGYGYLEGLDGTYDPKDVIRESLTIRGNGKLYFRSV